MGAAQQNTGMNYGSSQNNYRSTPMNQSGFAQSMYSQNPYQQNYGGQQARFGINTGQPIGQTNNQYFGNPQYDNQMPWMNQFQPPATQNIDMQNPQMQNVMKSASSAMSMLKNKLPQIIQPQQAQQPASNDYYQFSPAPPAVPTQAPDYASNPSPLSVDDIRARLFASTGGNVTPGATDFYKSQFQANPDGSQNSFSASAPVVPGSGWDYWK